MAPDPVAASPAENAAFIKRSYVKNGGYALVIMVLLVLGGYLFPPFKMLGSYLRLVGYLVGGAAAGYYFSQDLDRKKIDFQTRHGLLLWLACAVAFIGGIMLAGTVARMIQGSSLVPALSGMVRSLFSTGSATTTAASLVLGLLGIALGRDIYLEQFTMLKPLSREKAVEVREFTYLVRPLIEARHRFGRSFTLNQLSDLLPDRTQWASVDGTISDLKDQGLVTVENGTITITSKGENLLYISRFVSGLRERGEEGAELCAYCGKPLRLSDKLMRINYYGKPYTMHYAEGEGVRIFGRLPYIDKVLGLKPAEVARHVYRKAKVLPTVDHKASMVLGILGAAFAMISYSWMMINAESLPIASEVSFFGGTLLSVSLIFALCGIMGGLLTYINPGRSYGGGLMLALLFFAMPFICLTREVVFGGYYASVGLIAIGGVISLKAHAKMV